jgi:hypothetical protein
LVEDFTAVEEVGEGIGGVEIEEVAVCVLGNSEAAFQIRFT